MADPSKLLTEQRNPATMHIDVCSSLEIVDLINAQDRTVPDAVDRERENIAQAVDLVVEAFGRGGRLIYVGAGTSGRLGVLDASECPPTFGVPAALVRGIIAGGPKALTTAVEGAEDSNQAGAEAMDEAGLAPSDVLVGIATSGTTPYVHGALRRAKEIGAGTVFITCNPDVQTQVEPDVQIRPLVGPEAITGSTRLKAGTATKLVLNTLTTAAMIRTGRVYENLMVDLRATNSKLRDRAQRIVMTVTGVDRAQAQALLERADGRVKTAIVMQALGVDATAAQQRLDTCGGFVRRAIEQEERDG